MQAYKLLAKQEGISNNKAKKLIDDGLVSVDNEKLEIARMEVNAKTRFSIKKIAEPKVIFEDQFLIAVNKPAFLNSEDIKFKDAQLIHRLDKETSGILLFSKDEEFRLKCVEEFKAQRVKKIYTAWVEGMVIESCVIDKPIKTIKKGAAYSKIAKDGKSAKSIVTPLEVHGKKSKVQVEITTGRTHQIRVHLQSINHPIIGDKQYGSRYKSGRILLHAGYIQLLNYEIKCEEPKDFKGFS